MQTGPDRVVAVAGVDKVCQHIIASCDDENIACGPDSGFPIISDDCVSVRCLAFVVRAAYGSSQAG